MSKDKRYEDESIVSKVGGRFRLSALVQKRLQELNRGARPMVDVKADHPMEIVYAEIAADKLSFEPEHYDGEESQEGELGLEDMGEAGE